MKKLLSFAELVEHLACGDAKVVAIINSLVETDPGRTVTALNTLDDHAVRGTAILEIYKNCGWNTAAFFTKVERLNKGDKRPRYSG